MSVYIIGIGGTGHRVIESLLNLAAAGAVPTDTMKILCVDSDVSNGNLDSLIGKIKLYRDSSQHGTVFAPKLETAVIGHADSDNPCWSPTLANSTMEGLFNKNGMDPDGKRVFDSLFTAEEQTVVLNEGFYGHTSIGALLFAEQIRPDGVHLCPIWDNFFNGINHNEDKIILIGSTFGGTGASGIPVISSILRQSFPEAKIAALLVMPYFKFIKSEEVPQPADNPTSWLNSENRIVSNDIAIDWTYFMPKTKAAFSYYEKQNFSTIFNDIYIIGESPKNFVDVKYSKGASSQANKPHIIELFASTAIVDFIQNASASFTVKCLGREVEAVNGNLEHLSTMAMLVTPQKDATLPVSVAVFMRFCVMYTKYYYHCLINNKGDGTWSSLYNKIDHDELKALYDFCISYMKWIRKAHLKTDADGMVSDITEPSVKFFNFQRELYHLFDYAPIKGGFFGNNIMLDPLDAIKYMIVDKEACDANTINIRFNELKCDTSKSDIANLYNNLMSACAL